MIAVGAREQRCTVPVPLEFTGIFAGRLRQSRRRTAPNGTAQAPFPGREATCPPCGANISRFATDSKLAFNHPETNFLGAPLVAALTIA